jgi:hypothetical protein
MYTIKLYFTVLSLDFGLDVNNLNTNVFMKILVTYKGQGK